MICRISLSLVTYYINVSFSRYSMEKERLRTENNKCKGLPTQTLRITEKKLHLIHEFCGKEEAKNVNEVLRSREKL